MNKRTTPILLLILFSFLITDILLASTRMYRFKDKDGKVVVSSTLPPEVSQDGYEIINDKGIVIKTVEPRKTEQQLLEELANKKKQEEEDRKRREQEQLDSILINSYTDISDIERARDNELVGKDRDIMLFKNNIRRLTRLLENTQARAARDERLGKEISKRTQNEINGFKKRIASEEKNVIKVEEDKQAIDERYASSIIRFSELKAAEQLRRHKPGDLATEDAKAVIYQCTSAGQCDTAWSAALRYASEHSTTDLAWANDTTIMMRKPQKNNDISIVVTRVPSRSGDSASLVMEVRCHKSQKGEDFCQSETVRSVEKGFIPFIQ